MKRFPRFPKRTARLGKRWSIPHSAVAVILLLGFSPMLSLGAPKDSPLSPADALGAFQVDSGLQVGLVAAEPLTVAPCAMAWDTAGRLFVVENRGYPTGPANGQPAGVIAMLEDTDGDERMDRRTVFADGLTFPNGILPWQGGFIVTCAPDVFYFKDHDGDGRADERRVLLTGFDTSGSTQLRVAHPILGPDGWIYLTSGLTRAGNITSPQYPERAAVRIVTDARFHPVTMAIEAMEGRGQFGQSFDDWGNRFHCMNRVHVQHSVLPARFLRRNPDYAFSDTVQNVPESMVDDLLKAKNLAARIYPISDNITTADSHAGTFSAACAVHVYRGNNLPVEYYGDVFACDPTGNLVHRDRLTAVGPTFSSRMVHEGREFLASRDNWFRPVYLASGPDGALYVCDMYRKTIEHPDYLPVEVRKRTDFESGKTMGRIWRVAAQPESKSKPTKEPKSFSQFFRADSDGQPISTQALVALLGHSNVWQRETALRLLLERGGSNAIPVLLALWPTPEGKSDNELFLNANRQARETPEDFPAVQRAQALNLLLALSGWNPGESKGTTAEGLDPSWRKAIAQRLFLSTVDPSPGVRLAAWRWIRLMPHPGPEIADPITMHWARDPSPAVRFEVALALGSWEGGATLPALVEIALQDGADRWTRAAVMSGIKGRETEFLDRLVHDPNRKPSPELMEDLGAYLARQTHGKGILTPANSQAAGWAEADWPWQLAFWSGAVEVLRRQGSFDAQHSLLAGLGFTADGQDRIMDRCTSLLQNDQQPLAVRESAARLLFASFKPAAIRPLEDILRPGHPPTLQSTAVSLLADWPDDAVPRELLQKERWETLSPAHRELLMSGLLARPATTRALLASIQEGRLPASALTVSQRDQLRKHREPDIREQANQLFARAGGDRMKIFETYRDVLALTPVAAHGRELFVQQCASCHRLDRAGANVGPDLFGIRNQPKETTLLHVLVPNYEVLAGFSAYEVETKDGRSLSGLIVSETDTSVNLRQAQGLEETLRRQDIQSLKASTVSLMPEGLEETLGRQGLADLLAYLKGEGE